MVDNIHQKRIWRSWNQCGSICLHLRRHIWNSHVHERSITSPGHEGTPACKRPNLHQAGDPIEKHTDLLKHWYIIVGQNLPFSLERAACIWNSAVATGSRWRWSGAIRFHTPSLPQKQARAFSWPGVEATPILATEITWWHGNGDCGCSRFKL